MKWKKKTKHPIVELFLKQPLFLGRKRDKIPVMNFMRGNPDSKILCMAPPPTPEEYALNLPLSRREAQVFHNILAHSDISSERDMLVVSCSRFGVKPSKASCTPVFDFLAQVVKLKHFDMFICIGDEAFKHIFSYGRKANMQTLVGNIVYLAQLDHVPLFTFPPLDGLALPDDGVRVPASMYRWHKKCLERMTRITQEFAKIRKLLVK